MWIRTQDKKKLITNISFISVERNFGGKNKASIVAGYGEPSFIGQQTEILGLYKTEEEARSQLDAIQGFIATQPGDTVFELK